MTLRSYTTIILTSIILLSCSQFSRHTRNDVQATPITIHRFDKDLLRLIDSGDSTQFAAFLKEYPEMTAVLGKAIFNIQSPETPGFYEKLVKYYSEPSLKALYKDAVARYDTTETIEKELGEAFAFLHDQFPMMQIPAVYMHVSGFNQNILVGDSVLSISIDKYLGEDYPLYQQYFYPFQRQQMTHAKVIADYLSGWLMTEFPFEGKENVLLDRMIYEGKLQYILSQALPEKSPEELMGYTDSGWNWCKDHETQIWKTIIERKNLYTPDIGTTNLYFEQNPSTFLSDEAPGMIGVWIGRRIVEKYMKESGNTLLQLMHNQDAEAILAASKYK